jgi:hypothetical protein
MANVKFFRGEEKRDDNSRWIKGLRPPALYSALYHPSSLRLNIVHTQAYKWEN